MRGRSKAGSVKIATPQALSAQAGSGTRTVPPQSPSAANQETEIAELSRGPDLFVSGSVAAGNTVI